jgi:RNA polymerase sigma-70 factor, ECF subfamily
MASEERYTAIVAEHKDRIYRMCCCYVRDQEARKDAYQQTLIHIWQNLESFEGRSQLGTWIYRITVNTCLSLLRAEQRRQNLFRPGESVPEEQFPVQDTNDDHDDKDHEVEMLFDCIDALPLLDRTLMSLYLEDLSTAEMADVLDISESNVRVKIHRIKKNLKVAMERKRHGSGQLEGQSKEY